MLSRYVVFTEVRPTPPSERWPDCERYESVHRRGRWVILGPNITNLPFPC